MSVAGFNNPTSADPPGYWRDFPDITEKDDARISRFRASDGCNLVVYEFGREANDAVVIVNPLSTPFLLLAGLVGELAKRYRVVSWETRGGPFLGEDASTGSVSLDRQARDFMEIVEDKGLDGFHAVSLCSGAPIIARAASGTGVPIRSISLNAPSGAGTADTRTQYQDVFAPMILEAGTSDTAEARRNAQVMQDYVQARHVDDGLKDQVSRLTYLNLRDLDSITGFARVMSDYWSLDIGERHAEFDEMCRRHPVMVMHAMDDPTVHYSASLKACLRTGLPKLVLHPTGGHFKLSERGSEAMRDVIAFMAAHDRPDLDWPALTPGLYLGPIVQPDWL